ncbi:MAG TPA: phospho-N-acetylmuramoyl-pentapeptide-transferase, partial [Bacteroidales bacterium]|nr:phospho-N-acetylmuramoyl-pentapeptide-transferase [Bacteroidales bacterium]
MFYYLFEYLEKMDIPGAGMFQYISFRSALTAITSLIIALIFGKKIINYLRRQQIGEDIRDLGLEGQMSKKGTPTMGGVIILASIIIPTILFADVLNIYVFLMLITTIWLGFIGFLDDYIKTFRKNKKGLAGKFKIIGQIGLGLIVGLTLYLSDDVVIRENVVAKQNITPQEMVNIMENPDQQIQNAQDVKSTKTTIPFFKNNEFDYEYL